MVLHDGQLKPGPGAGISVIGASLVVRFGKELYAVDLLDGFLVERLDVFKRQSSSFRARQAEIHFKVKEICILACKTKRHNDIPDPQTQV